MHHPDLVSNNGFTLTAPHMGIKPLDSPFSFQSIIFRKGIQWATDRTRKQTATDSDSKFWRIIFNIISRIAISPAHGHLPVDCRPRFMFCHATRILLMTSATASWDRINPPNSSRLSQK